MKSSPYSSPYGRAPKQEHRRERTRIIYDYETAAIHKTWWVMDEAIFIFSPEDLAMDKAYVVVGGRHPNWFTHRSAKERLAMRAIMNSKCRSNKDKHDFWRRLHAEYNKQLVLLRLKS